MLKFLESDSTKSSARLINFMGAILGAMLLAYDTYAHGSLNTANFIAYLSYCGMGYGISKGLDKLGAKQQE